MDIVTSIYSQEDIPDEYLNFLSESINEINKLLNMEYYLSEIHSVDSILEDYEDYPFKPELTKYFRDLLGDDIAEIYANMVIEPTEQFIRNMVRLRNLIAEQDMYIESTEKDCEIYLITAYVDGELYGSVYGFYNHNYPSVIMIQGISKSLKYGLSDIFGVDNHLPKLNSVLMPAIESLGRRLGANQIHVSPIGKQGAILERHYGFKRVDAIRYPCHIIAGSDMVGGNNYYMKVIP